jgi:multiple sugar transport system ATP-binding protein
MDVSKNMGFSLLLKKAEKTTIDARVDGAAKRLGLDTFLQRLPRQLSGGQRQRVAMGRAIVRDPKVFLFDEPLSNLDAKLRVHMRAEIKALHQQLKTTSVYVTHDQIEAMTMADRIVVMHDGLIQQVGAPLDLYDRPANMFVAGFIGSPGMNFLPATVRKGGTSDAVLADGQALKLPDGLPLQDGDAITVGLRPEHIRLADDGALQGEVGVVEPLGLSTQFYVRFAGQQVCVFVMGRSTIRPGDTVRLSADPAALHLFDPASGNRIG